MPALSQCCQKFISGQQGLELIKIFYRSSKGFHIDLKKRFEDAKVVWHKLMNLLFCPTPLFLPEDAKEIGFKMKTQHGKKRELWIWWPPHGDLSLASSNGKGSLWITFFPRVITFQTFFVGACSCILFLVILHIFCFNQFFIQRQSPFKEMSRIWYQS